MSAARPRILVDAALSAGETFEAFGEVDQRPAAQLLHGDLSDVQALVVRTQTRVDAQLLRAAPQLRFVGSASAGVDHVDLEALREAKIHFAHARGCNAQAVAQWVVAAMLHSGALVVEDARVRSNGPVGVVGVGATGGALERLLGRLGVETWLCDPIRHGAGSLPQHRSLAQVEAGCASLSFHVPLTGEGPHPSYRSFGAERVHAWLHAGKSLVNASRGDVIELPEPARMHEAQGKLMLDVWPGEPQLDWRWLRAPPSCLRAATPHVAGYSRLAKRRATQMILDALGEAWGQPAPRIAQAEVVSAPRDATPAHPNALGAWLDEVAGLTRDGEQMAACARLGDAEARARRWRELRSNYPLRAEFGELSPPAGLSPALGRALGFAAVG